MDKINYPLLYYQLKPSTYLGILVGTGYQVMEKDLRTMKQNLKDHLQKQYKKFDDYPYMNMIEPKLKVFEIKIRPSYKENSGAYPLNQTLKVPVPVVYGETDRGDYECYLPLFNESFYYYEVKQFKSLVVHFSTALLNNLSPDQIYRHLRYKQAKLDTISLRVNFDRAYNPNANPLDHQANRLATLSKLAERFPYQKTKSKARNAFPEAAWELEDKVTVLIDKLINLRANVLVVGNHGVGKTAVLMQAIKKITNKSRQQNLAYSFWRIMPQRITASAKYLGEWQETCELLIEDLQAANGTLWVMDMIRLLQTGGSGPEDSVASFLISFMQQGKLQMIGEVTEKELDSLRRLLPGFVENFQILKVEELPEQKIQSILDKFMAYSQKNLKVSITSDALKLAYRLLLRYYPYESFPGKAIKFLGQCVSDAMNVESFKVDQREVVNAFVAQTGLPEIFLRDDLLLDVEELHEHFRSNIIGQPNAIEKLSGVIKIFKAGLNNPYKPISTLIFAGPTGVGKTASAKALADYFFGKGQRRSPLIRLDMSEFQFPGQIVNLIGSGKELGKLIQDIRERPFSVLLLDEIEKADPSIFDALLTVLDEGLMVDAYGRVTNFRNTIIIMTTNLGASQRKSISFRETTSDEDNYLSVISKHFRPEFVNRIDGVVIFNSLKEADILKITKKELNALKQREGFVKKSLQLKFTEGLINYLARKGFDEAYGARPLQRALEQSVVNPIANWLLEHPQVQNCTIKVDYHKNGLQISKV
ncbi:MAG: AAA family ATPase [Saprospiraceae bacterium]